MFLSITSNIINYFDIIALLKYNNKTRWMRMRKQLNIVLFPFNTIQIIADHFLYSNVLLIE